MLTLGKEWRATLIRRKLTPGFTRVEAPMSIPLRVTSYLEQHGVRYEVCAHGYSRTSAQTARQAHVPPHLLAKSVLVEDDGGCVLAVLPADRQVKLRELGRLLAATTFTWPTSRGWPT